MTSPQAGSDVSPLAPYDGILLLSFGGPEKPDDVMPFLRIVTAGRGIPDERLTAVAEHYQSFGGKSPINDQNRLLLAALRSELDRRELTTPLLWGNRNFDPFLTDTLREAHEAGMRRLVTIVTSAYTSYSSCRQYREDLAAAVATLADEGREIEVDKVRPYFNHPGFSRANARQVTEAVRGLRERPDDEVRLVFVTHSIPEAMDDTSGPGDGEGNAYRREHLALAAAITDEVNATLGRGLDHELVYCSRSGPPTQPWLEPDVNDALRASGLRRGQDRGRGADRVRLGSHGGQVRPRHRSRADSGRRRPGDGAGAHRWHRPRVRLGAGRPGSGAGRTGSGLLLRALSGMAQPRGVPAGLSSGLLPQSEGGQARLVRVRLMCPDLSVSGQSLPEEPLSKTLGQPLLRELEDLAVSAARAAGRFIVHERPRGLGVLDTKSSINDIVTVMDQQSEALLRAHLLGARPDDAILGEEDGASQGPRASPGSSTRSTAP